MFGQEGYATGGSTVFGLAEWLFSNHGLTLQATKTKILPVSRYINEVISTPEENLTDRDNVISLLRETTKDSQYEDEEREEDEDPDDVEVDSLLEQLQGYDLKGMFIGSISDQTLVDYEMVRYVLTRLPRIRGADENLKLENLGACSRQCKCFCIQQPNISHGTSYRSSNFSAAEKRRIAKKLLRPLKSKRNRPPAYYAMWILYIFTTSKDWDHVSDIVALYRHATSDVVKRYASLAIAVGGTRSEALVVKEGPIQCVKSPASCNSMCVKSSWVAMNVGTGNLAIRLSVLSRNISSGETRTCDSALLNQLLSILGVRLEELNAGTFIQWSFFI